MEKQGKLFDEDPPGDLPTTKSVLAEMGRIAMNGMREVDRIAAAKVYLDKIKDVIDDDSEGAAIDINITVRKSGD